MDDGSSDGTVEYLRNHRSEVRLICQQNSGPGAARNRGVDAATGDWIAFLDSDDLWFPWTLEHYERAIAATDAKLLFAKPMKFRRLDEVEALIARGATEPGWDTFEDYFASGNEWRWWGASSFAVRRDEIRSARFSSDPINGEDADWIMQLGHNLRLVQLTAAPSFGYREHDGSVMKNWDKNLAGAWNLVSNEKSQLFPGGGARQRERWSILGRHLRPVILESLRSGHREEGVKLLRATLRWHLVDRRFRFLAASLFQLIGFQR
ncbi:glycosyltransferase family 2 protein [Akkermansiaceae bacterium]|nr:glycosyltransferase family 2 protein [Akkermansiaceae bacterium]